MNWVAVGAGAAIGAWLRWGLSQWLNHSHSHLPLGTLLANLVGGFLIGVAVGFFGSQPGLPEAWRLFVITGFLGGLTTFSTFSVEAVNLLHRTEYAWALLHAGAHLFGAILFCIAGMSTYRALAG